MVLILDNYDSFTHNLYQLIKNEEDDVRVFRSDKISLQQIEEINPDHIVLSPGPGRPEDAGIFMDVVRYFKYTKPILGICLGHQAILAESGVPIVKAKQICHGKIDDIIHRGKGVFRNIKRRFSATRYHSLVARTDEIPEDFFITATSSDQELMAVQHKHYDLTGIQFHPESIGSEFGSEIIKNFLSIKNKSHEKQLLKKVLSTSLNFEESVELMELITEGKMDDAKIASIMTVYNFRNITSDELAGFASVLREKAMKFPQPEKGEIRIDTCGTGGAEIKTFNVSTTATFVLAAAGINVVKHGNRAVTSRSGSMDLLEKLGIDISISPDKSYEIFTQTKMAFLYAPLYHSAMKYASNARKSLSFRSFFNMIGPLSNPAGATHQIIGIYDKKYLETVCEALKKLGTNRALVVSSSDGLDEISVCDTTHICELNDGKIMKYDINPEELGIKAHKTHSLKGGGSNKNSEITVDILSTDKCKFENMNEDERARFDMVALNAGAALYICGKAKNIHEGFQLAAETIKSGRAFDILLSMREKTSFHKNDNNKTGNTGEEKYGKNS